MQLIAITGGIGSGKSTIAEGLASLGAYRIDADQLARDAVEPEEPALRQIIDHFGAELLKPDGRLDRAALGAVVFSDPKQLQRLNEIVHPAVRRLFLERLTAITQRDPDAVVVYEIPLLVETENDIDWDLVVAAEAPVETRIERLATHRGMSGETARARIDNQASDEERRRVADVIIDTSGSRAETQEQVVELWKQIQRFLATSKA